MMGLRIIGDKLSDSVISNSACQLLDKSFSQLGSQVISQFFYTLYFYTFAMRIIMTELSDMMTM